MCSTTQGTNLLGQALQRRPVHFQNDVPDLDLPALGSWLPREELLHPHNGWSQLLWGQVILTAETEPEAWAVLQEFYLKCVLCKRCINLLFPIAHSHGKSVCCSYSRHDNAPSSPSHGSFTELKRSVIQKIPPGLKRTKKLITTSQSACLVWHHQHAERQSVSKGLYPRKSIKEYFKAQSGTPFPATDQALVGAATGVPGRQDRSHARRPKGICRGSAIWVGFPSFAQATSKRGWIMPTSSQEHKSFSLLRQELQNPQKHSFIYKYLNSPWHPPSSSTLFTPTLLQLWHVRLVQLENNTKQWKQTVNSS